MCAGVGRNHSDLCLLRTWLCTREAVKSPTDCPYHDKNPLADAFLHSWDPPEKLCSVVFQGMAEGVQADWMKLHSQFKNTFTELWLALLISPRWAKDNNSEVAEHLSYYVILFLRNLLVWVLLKPISETEFAKWAFSGGNKVKRVPAWSQRLPEAEPSQIPWLPVRLGDVKSLSPTVKWTDGCEAAVPFDNSTVCLLLTGPGASGWHQPMTEGCLVPPAHCGTALMSSAASDRPWGDCGTQSTGLLPSCLGQPPVLSLSSGDSSSQRKLQKEGKNSWASTKSHNEFSAEDGQSGNFHEDTAEIGNSSLRTIICGSFK